LYEHFLDILACSGENFPHCPATNFVCRWQGSVHDSAVFKGSMVHAHLEDGGGQNGCPLGDRGYGIQPYLLTPFRPDDVSTGPQRRYQKAHTKTKKNHREGL